MDVLWSVFDDCVSECGRVMKYVHASISGYRVAVT